MARKRLVSPRFFKHAALYKAERASGLPLRLAYQGLWCQCDRRGLFRWEPEELKLDCLPYDQVDFEQVMWTLVQYGFVVCYDVGGKRYGFVPTFGDHQTFHRDEKPDKTIPDVSEGVVVAQVTTVSTSQAAPQHCEHRASTVSAPCEHRGSTPITITVTDTITNPNSAPRKRSAKPVEDDEADDAKKYPHFGQVERGRCIAAFRKVGEYPPGRVVKVLAPYFRPATDPTHIPHDKVAFAVEDYCGVIGRGFSARWVSPEDCAKKLLLMAKNCVQYEDDPFGRLDAQMVAVHGKAQVAA
jgi:hypothetical protein